MIFLPKKRILHPLVLISLAVIFAIMPVLSQLNKPAEAAGVSGWQAGNIIDDTVMTNKTTMTAAQIQSFLNSKVPTCDTNGTQKSELAGG